MQHSTSMFYIIPLDSQCPLSLANSLFDKSNTTQDEQLQYRWQFQAVLEFSRVYYSGTGELNIRNWWNLYNL